MRPTAATPTCGLRPRPWPNASGGPRGRRRPCSNGLRKRIARCSSATCARPRSSRCAACPARSTRPAVNCCRPATSTSACAARGSCCSTATGCARRPARAGGARWGPARAGAAGGARGGGGAGGWAAGRRGPVLKSMDAKSLSARLAQGGVAPIDVRGSMQFRAGHIPQARWSIRPRLAADTKGETRQIVLVADDAALAAWAAMSELDGHAPLLLEGGMPAWRAAGLPLQATPALPADADCIDYLFFVHDRHDGNKEAARRYLAWETGLVAQLDAQERAAFRLPSAASHA